MNNRLKITIECDDNKEMMPDLLDLLNDFLVENCQTNIVISAQGEPNVEQDCPFDEDLTPGWNGKI